MISYIFLGYKLRPSKRFDTFMTMLPEENESRQDAAVELNKSIYGVSFEQLFMIDANLRRPNRWDYKPDPEKPSIARRARSWLLEGHAEKLTGTGKIVFVGFNPRRALQLLALECAMESCQLPPGFAELPVHDWNERFLAPAGENKWLIWPRVLLFWGIVPKEGWEGPGKDVEEDARLSTELVGKFMLPRV